MASSSKYCLLILMIFSINALLLSTPSKAQQYPPIAPGLSFGFYSKTCPNLEIIVRRYLKSAFGKDTGLAAGLLRLHFHDCFVQGCDGSLLLDGTPNGPSERDSPPNQSLRPTAFKAINDIKALVTQAGCGQVVSCADITALAAREAVLQSKGPPYKVPLGRRDSKAQASNDEVLKYLPRQTIGVPDLLAALKLNNLSATDLVALSGGHTIGVGHCSSFYMRLFPQDPTLDSSFADGLKRTCPTSNSPNTQALDVRTPNIFDNQYYVDLVNRQGLFTSDQDLFNNDQTKWMVTSYAQNQTLFFEKFVYSMTKMGQLKVLTGTQGDIRANCGVANRGVELLVPVGDGDGDGDGDGEAMAM